MLDREGILYCLQVHYQELRERFTVSRIGFFGSYARDEAKPGSDVDILVDLTEPTFDHFMDLKFHLEALLGASVDLVLADAVKPRLRSSILKEVINAEGSPALPG